MKMTTTPLGSPSIRHFFLHFVIFSISLLVTQAEVFADFVRTFDDPTPAEFDFFGGTVAISGNNVLISAVEDDTTGPNVGQALLFDAVTGNLLQTFNDPTVTSQGQFGLSLAIEGNNVLIGDFVDSSIDGIPAGQAHLFDAATGNLLQTFDNPTRAFSQRFGSSVSINGTSALIGVPGITGDSGQARLFDIVTGDLLQTFNNPSPSVGDEFGGSVVISGNNVLIGASGDDTNGTNVGQAYLFDAVTGDLLQTFDDPTVTSSDFFGGSVAISGNNVLIGASGDDTNGSGQAYLFDVVTGDLLQTFDDPTITFGDEFGSSVSIRGNNVLIGASDDDTSGPNVGQAYLFDAVTGTLLQIFDDPTVTGGDRFGFSVAISENNVLVGALGDNTNGSFSGQAHLFTIVPEPSTALLLLMGFVASLRGRRKRGV